MDKSQRIKAIKDALEDFDENSGIRREVAIRGQKVAVKVVSLDPGLLLLNHENFRIHSQLEDSPQKDKVLQDPSDAEAQRIIEDLLSATKDFKALKEQLKEYGQQEPGLISSEGLLVNGNTRAVALRQLKSPGMLVGVLPSSANGKDLILIQSDLQMQRWIHQDYSFTNELLFLEELKNTLKLDDASIVKRLGWRSGRASEKKLQKKFRLLSLIREVKSVTERPIPYSFFDDKSQILEDLDTDYEKEKERDYQRAERLKEVKLIAMIRGLTKDQVRIIEPEVVIHSDENDVIAPPKENKLKKVANQWFTEGGEPQLASDPEEVKEAKDQKAEAENAINAKRIRNILDNPVSLLTDATNKIKDLLLDLATLSDQADFDKDTFLNEASKLEETYAKLAEALARLRQQR